MASIRFMKHFLSIVDWTEQELQTLLGLALQIKISPQDYATTLKGRNIALLFMKPSTRTRVSFEVGVNQLGGHPIVLTSRDLQLGRGETIADTARVLSRYVDCVMARVFGHDILEGLAQWGSIPIINGLSDLLHPCQAICDFQTMHEHFGSLEGLRFAYIGDGNNMAHSLMYAGAAYGVDVTIAAPDGYAPDAEILTKTHFCPAHVRDVDSAARWLDEKKGLPVF